MRAFVTTTPTDRPTRHALWMLGLLLLPWSSPAEEPAPQAYGVRPVYTSRLRLDVDYRKQGDAEDTDLYGYWYGSGRDLKGGMVDFYTSGRVHTDLDHEAESQADDPYFSLDDSDDTTEQRLLQLYADVHHRQKRWQVRGGRQYIEIADYLHLDGAQVMLREQEKLGGRVYFGQPVSYYTSVSGDYAGGVSLVGRPWAGNRTRLTLAQYHDDSSDGTDDNLFFDTQQELTDSLRTRAQLSILNEDFRMGRVDVYYFSPDGETDLYGGASRWGSFDAETRAYSPLYNVLGKQEPYTYAYARLTQVIVPKVLVSPGASVRFTDENFSNRDYSDYDLTLIYEPSKALSSSISLQYWDISQSDSFVGVSGEVRYRYRRLWEITGGAAYAKYTYDTFSDIAYSANGGQTTFTEEGTVIEESPDVYTYFLRAKWKMTKKLTLRLQGDVEDDQASDDLAYRARGSVEVRF